MRLHRSIVVALAAALLSTAGAVRADEPPDVRPPPPPPSGEARPDQVAPPPGEVKKQVFVERLTPYGQWVNTPEYGQVFVPNSNATPGWRPYYYGHWALTDWGWTWVSDEPYGWATYHYGRWYMGSFGWYWVPGRVWGPAWVSWRWNAGYVAWVPLVPRGGVVWGVSSPHWVAVTTVNFTRPIRSVALPVHATAGVVAQTRPLAGPYARPIRGVYGPPVSHIAQATGQRLTPVAAGRVVAGAVPHAQSGYARATPRRDPHPPGAPKAGPSRKWRKQHWR
jgi:hypothetical protein